MRMITENIKMINFTREQSNSKTKRLSKVEQHKIKAVTAIRILVTIDGTALWLHASEEHEIAECVPDNKCEEK